MPEEVKEVQMDVPVEGRRSRKRRSGPRKTRAADKEESTTVVTKDEAVKDVVAKRPAPPSKIILAPPKIVLAPPKKKPAKVMLVPKGKTVSRPLPSKTFKAKRVKVTIDNTAKTQKHRKTVLAKVDDMTDDQIRGAAVQARLSRRETVFKAPIELLRQMIKDYQTMKGQLL